MKQLILEHKNSLKLGSKPVYPRSVLLENSEKIEKIELIAISGISRTGKTFCIKYLINKLLSNKIRLDNILYINFYDERLLNFKLSDLKVLTEAFYELKSPIGMQYIFFDNVHNLKGWEKWDFNEKIIKLFVTLCPKVPTLNKRYVNISLMPLSFKEYIQFKNIDISNINFNDIDLKITIKNLFLDYIKSGGFPGDNLQNNFDIQSIYRNLIIKEVVSKNTLKSSLPIRRLCLYLLKNPGTINSYRNLQAEISTKSTNTIKKYLDYLEDVSLFFKLYLFDFSINKRKINSTKLYCVDHSLVNSLNFETLHLQHQLIENMVFLTLKSNKLNPFYWKTRNGALVSFIVRKGIKFTEIIQVSKNSENKTICKKELSSAVCAAKRFELSNVTIITDDHKAQEKHSDININYVPAYEWLMH